MSITISSDEILLLQSVGQILYGHVALVLIIVGTVGNLLNILVFIRLKTFHQMPTSTFLLTSFVASVVQLWTARFSRSMLNITGVDPLVSSIFYCKARWYLGRMSSNISLTCISLANIDRFLITSRNARCRRLFTVQRARLTVIIFIVLYSGAFIPDTIYYSAPLCTAPTSPFVYRQFIIYFNLIVTSILPLLILSVFSMFTWRNLRASWRGQRNRLQEQVTRMMLAEFLTVFLTTLPIVMLNIYTLATQSVVKSQLRLAQENLWSTVFNLVSFTTHVGMFYIYLIVSRAYRQNVRTALCCTRETRVAIVKVPVRPIAAGHT